MENQFEVLDFIQQNEERWIKLRKDLKEDLYGGLAELASFNLTREGVGLDTSTLIEGESKEIVKISEEGIVLHNTSEPKLSFPYNNPNILRARRRFKNALNIIIDLTNFRLKLSELLSENKSDY